MVEAEVRVRVRFERGDAPHTRVAAGPGWAEIEVRAGAAWAGADVAQAVRAGRAAAAALLAPPSGGHAVLLRLGGVEIAGRWLPGAADAAATERAVREAWLSGRETAAVRSEPLAGARPSGSGPPKLGGPREGAGDEQGRALAAVGTSADGAPLTLAAMLGLPGPEPETKGRRAGPADLGPRDAEAPADLKAHEALIREMVCVVRAYREQFGSAPDFRTAPRQKAHNYIRSTAGQPQADRRILEEVRLRLAADG